MLSVLSERVPREESGTGSPHSDFVIMVFSHVYHVDFESFDQVAQLCAKSMQLVCRVVSGFMNYIL